MTPLSSVLTLQVVQTGFYGNEKPDSSLAGGAFTQKQMAPPPCLTQKYWVVEVMVTRVIS